MRRLENIRRGLLWLLFCCCQSVWAQTPLADSLAVQQEALAGNSQDKGWHQVQPGDTYYRLSKIYRVPVDSLLKWNGANLPVGKTIRVRSQAPATAQQSLVTSPEPSAEPAADSRKEALKTAEQPTVKLEKPAGTTSARPDEPTDPAIAKNEAQRIVIIPFDPHLYFSDADNDIARQSRLPAQNVRYIFRARLSAFLDPPGFKSISLLNAGHRDGVDELSKVYPSLAYSYQDITYSRFNPLPAKPKTLATGPKAWFQRQKEKIGAVPLAEEIMAGEGGKYYGVKVKNPDFYPYFNTHYHADYYLFINQFEIRTDYTNCIDRVTQNFVREFLVHYTIFDAKGELLAGNKVKIPYVSNVNDVDKIVRDNLSKMAQRILADLPGPQSSTSEAAQK